MKNNSKILIVAAHPDDEVIGCGGLIARNVRLGNSVDVVFMTDGVSSRNNLENEYLIENRKKNALLSSSLLGVNSTHFFTFPDNSMDVVPFLNIAKSVEDIINKIRPDIVITHSNKDLNIDHRLTHEAVLVATRPKPMNFVRKLMFFEIVSSTNWNPTANQFHPVEYVDIGDFIDLKKESLKCYESEICDYPHTRSIEGIINLNRYRGNTIGVSFAEAFEIGRIIS